MDAAWAESASSTEAITQGISFMGGRNQTGDMV